MAIVEQSSPVAVNFVSPDISSSQAGIGRVGPWQFVRLLSESQLSRVYLARPVEAPTAQGANYVVKMLRKEWWRDPQAIEMQRRAVRIGTQVSHPHLLPILSAGVQHAPFYYVTPRLAGASLAELLDSGQRIPLSLCLWITRQVAEALTELHATVKVIHSDVKPSNILVSNEGHATLIDLGFAYSPDEARHWSSRPVTGSLGYIAPEAVTSCLDANFTSDLYSLGATLYQLLSGQLPFPANSPDELVRAHREAKPTCIRELVVGLPKPIASLVHRLLAKDPLRRPSSAAEVAEELLRLEIESFAA